MSRGSMVDGDLSPVLSSRATWPGDTVIYKLKLALGSQTPSPGSGVSSCETSGELLTLSEPPCVGTHKAGHAFPFCRTSNVIC